MKDDYTRGQESDTIDVSELLNADGTVNTSAVKARQSGGVTPSLCAELRERLHDEAITLNDLAAEYDPAASTIKDHIKGYCTCPTDVTPVRSTRGGKSWVKMDRCGETRVNGQPCKRITGGDACWQHDDTERCGAATNTLTPCREPATEGDRCWRHTDRDSVTCPHADCERTFDSDHALKAHHYQAHGESLIPESECKHCGTSFRPPAKNEGVYCSTECMAADYDTSVTIACEHCGDEFEVQAHMADERRFCSHECTHASRESKIACECAYCGERVCAVASLSCGRSGRRTAHNTVRRKSRVTARDRPTTPCWCGCCTTMRAFRRRRRSAGRTSTQTLCSRRRTWPPSLTKRVA